MSLCLYTENTSKVVRLSLFDGYKVRNNYLNDWTLTGVKCHLVLTWWASQSLTTSYTEAITVYSTLVLIRKEQSRSNRPPNPPAWGGGVGGSPGVIIILGLPHILSRLAGSVRILNSCPDFPTATFSREKREDKEPTICSAVAVILTMSVDAIFVIYPLCSC